jgi:cbb3-type cytochrome oxidase maturation protein
MFLVYFVIWTTAIVLAISAVWALVWAIRTGQFQNLHRGATVIFDEDEPIGEVTDRFPDKSRPASGASAPKAPQPYQKRET